MVIRTRKCLFVHISRIEGYECQGVDGLVSCRLVSSWFMLMASWMKPDYHWWCSLMWSGADSFVIHHHHKCTDQVLYGTATASYPDLGSEISVYGKNCMW